MHFLNPLFLFGFFALSIPIIVHLYNFRRYKIVYFSNLSYLKELHQETKKHSQLKQLLILIARLLAITCLVLAFAQPYFSASTKVLYSKNHVNVYVDNSFSMEAASLNGSLLNDAVNKAREIAMQYDPSDVFQLLTNDFELKHQRWVNRDEFLEFLTQIKISPATKKLSADINKQISSFQEAKASNKLMYVLSDFQKNSTNFSDFKRDTSLFASLIPIQSKQINNIYIDSCWMYSPVIQKGQPIQMLCRIRNASVVDVEKVPLKLTVNKLQKALASFDLKAGESTEIALRFMPDINYIQLGEIEISDYPIIYDDKFYFSFNIEPQIPILVLNQNQENPYISKLFLNDTMFRLVNNAVGNIDYSGLKNYRLVILNGLTKIQDGLSDELIKFVENGGSLSVFPGEDMGSDGYKDFLSSIGSTPYEGIDTINAKASEINLLHSIYHDVFEKLPENIDLPLVNSHYIFKKQNSSMLEPLVKLNNGDIFIASQSIGKGKLYLFTTPVDKAWTSFFEHAIWVPTLLKMAFLSLPNSSLFKVMGDDNVIEINNFNLSGDMNIKLKSAVGNFEMVPTYRNVENNFQILLQQQLPEAGNYLITTEGKNITGVSFNYNRMESDRAVYSPDELNTLIKNSNLPNYQVLNVGNKSITKEMLSQQQGLKLWKIFVVFCLLFFTAEVLLIRFLK